MSNLNSPIFFRLTKVDLIQRTVEGIATAEQPDKTGEICDYESTKPHYEKWSEGFRKATDGKSLGNVRAMHSNVAAGKVTALDFDDDQKEIRITAKIVDDAEWNKVAEGVYTGFSQGGEYIKKWKDGDFTRYTASPTEVSIVDNPCLPSATFQVVKENGATEMRKFHVKEDEPVKDEEKLAKGSEPTVEQGWRAKDGSFHRTKAEAVKHNQFTEAEEIAKAATAGITKLMGDINDKLDEDLYWKREFSDEERSKAAEAGQAMPDGSFPIKSEEDLKNAIRAVGRAKDPAKAKEHIETRAKALGLESLIPEEWHEKVAKKDLLKTGVIKGLHEVARVACLLEELDWLHDSLEFEEAMEDDDSENPEHLADIIKELCAFLTSLVEEETGEMVEGKGGTGIENAIEAAAGLRPSSAAAVLKFLKLRPAMKADHPARKLAAALEKANDGGEGFTEDHAHSDRVHAIHKCAGNVLHHCMKAMTEMHTEDHEETAEKLLKLLKEAGDHLKKAHKSAHEIMQHCMKMGSALEEGEDEGHEKFSKLQAVNDALTKTISDMTPKIGDLLKRIDHLERQPAVRKGALFDVNRSHEAEAGSPPVETANSNPYQALRLSPEAERRLRDGTN